MFSSSDYIITNVLLCMLVCMGGRDGKNYVHAKQLSYFKQSKPAQKTASFAKLAAIEAKQTITKPSFTE